jgi:hypothetical protein
LSHDPRQRPARPIADCNKAAKKQKGAKRASRPSDCSERAGGCLTGGGWRGPKLTRNHLHTNTTPFFPLPHSMLSPEAVNTRTGTPDNPQPLAATPHTTLHRQQTPRAQKNRGGRAGKWPDPRRRPEEAPAGTAKGGKAALLGRIRSRTERQARGRRGPPPPGARKGRPTLGAGDCRASPRARVLSRDYLPPLSFPSLICPKHPRTTGEAGGNESGARGEARDAAAGGLAEMARGELGTLASAKAGLARGLALNATWPVPARAVPSDQRSHRQPWTSQ